MIFNMAGGGASLNFKVVGGTTQPTSPKENTIWVNTSTAVTGWAFSAEQPASPQAGMVWFAIGAASDASFNALQKNEIHVYPAQCMQYVSGTWTEKTARIYKAGSWRDLKVWLYKNGDLCEGITGGWVNTPMGPNSSYSTYTGPTTVDYGTSSMTLTQSHQTGAFHHAKNKIDLTNVNQIIFTISNMTQSGGKFQNVQARSDLNGLGLTGAAAKTDLTAGDLTATIDVSSLSGEYYVGIYMYNGSTVTVHSIELA